MCAAAYAGGGCAVAAGVRGGTVQVPGRVNDAVNSMGQAVLFLENLLAEGWCGMMMNEGRRR